MEPITFEQLLEHWRAAALGFFGSQRGALHLTPDQWETLDAVLKAEGGDAVPSAFIEFELPDRRGAASLATDWPGGENYLIEVKVTTGLYDALVNALRSRWRLAGRSRPPGLGLLGNAAGLAQLWRRESGSNPPTAFERCSQRVVATEQGWRRGMARLLAPPAPRTRRQPRDLQKHEYRLWVDRSTGHVTASFTMVNLSTPPVGYDEQDRKIHDLMCRIQSEDTPMGERDKISYAQLEAALIPASESATTSPEIRKRRRERIRTAVSRFNIRWMRHLEDTLKERLEDQGFGESYNLFKGQSGPLQSVRGGGTWRIMVEIEEPTDTES
jgi:hypothetical protein